MGKTVGKTYTKKNKGGKAQTPPAQTPSENGEKQGDNEQ